MVGDVNIYMNDLDDMQLAEIEIMIAEPKRYLLFHVCLCHSCLHSPFSPLVMCMSCGIRAQVVILLFWLI